MLVFTIGACTQATKPTSHVDAAATKAEPNTTAQPGTPTRAYFAGGCFWCTESDFEKLPGVIEAISGYSGGDLENPTYKQVSYTETGHLEAVEVIYDPALVSYKTLVEYHFRHIDPTDDGGQFCDRGSSYRTAIFVQSPNEREIAEEAKANAETTLGQPVITPVIDFTKFWIAEDYHQDYYKKNPLRYQYYRTACGRDRRIAQLWGETASE